MAPVFDTVLVVVAAALVAVHHVGRRRLAGAGAAGGAGQAWAFDSALAVGTLLALSPLTRWSADELFARTFFDLAAAYVLAPLVVLGAPWQAFAAAAHRPGRQRARRPGQSGTDRRRARLTRHPLSGVATFLALLWLWHLPPLLDATVSAPALQACETLSLLAGGVALWVQLVGSRPLQPAWDPLRRTVLILVVLAGSSLLGFAMVVARTRWYPAFAHGHGALVSASSDQSFAGALTLAVPVVPLGALAIWCYSKWLERDEDEDRQLHELIDTTALPAVAAPGTAARQPIADKDGSSCI